MSRIGPFKSVSIRDTASENDLRYQLLIFLSSDLKRLYFQKLGNNRWLNACCVVPHNIPSRAMGSDLVRDSQQTQIIACSSKRLYAPQTHGSGRPLSIMAFLSNVTPNSYQWYTYQQLVGTNAIVLDFMGLYSRLWENSYR